MQRTIHRREAIKRAALLLGGSLFLPDIIKAWESPNILNTTYAASAEESAIIAEVAEMIIPTTSTAGAKTAGVPAFIEKIVTDCYSPDERNAFYKGLKKLEGEANSKYKKGFVACDNETRTALLKEIESARDPFWSNMKDLTVNGYFTSEIGITQNLRYEPIPGRFDGNYPYKKGDKLFATN